ncbi:histidine triad nucleotide-binding protein [Gammaproteobacteria bacterium]|nr:histidine triad nucleotide-binding protein [Gammaproteobacteria bacterium]
MSLTLFEKIINREIPADIIYEDELSIVIKDIQPQAPTHLLIIPKKVIPKLSDGLEEDKETLGHLMLVAGKVADLLNLDNTGAKAGQSVFHLHLHLLSGRSLNWPPG